MHRSLLVLILAFFGFGAASFGQRRRHPNGIVLCTYSDVSYTKCQHTSEHAQNISLDLGLGCVRRSGRAGCLTAVRSYQADAVILTGHGYRPARRQQLKPLLYERVNASSFYLAVVPRNISYVDLATGPIDVDRSAHRAFHAAAFFNLQRGHDICRQFQFAADEPAAIRIVDSAAYSPTEDEILYCANGSYAEASEYRTCNVEAELQRAAFFRRNGSKRAVFQLSRIFAQLNLFFGRESQLAGVDFNFFDTFAGEDNVIFDNNAVALDLQPTYRNGVTERVYDKLHCASQSQEHESSQPD